MHSNSLGCPKILPLSAPVLYWLSHLTCISSLKAKNERKTLIYTQLKISRYNQHFLTIFFTNSCKNDLRPIYCSPTCCKITTQSLPRHNLHLLNKLSFRCLRQQAVVVIVVGCIFFCVFVVVVVVLSAFNRWGLYQE